MFVNLYILLFINEGQGALRTEMEQSLKLSLSALCCFLSFLTVWEVLGLCTTVPCSPGREDGSVVPHKLYLAGSTSSLSFLTP